MTRPRHARKLAGWARVTLVSLGWFFVIGLWPAVFATSIPYARPHVADLKLADAVLADTALADAHVAESKLAHVQAAIDLGNRAYLQALTGGDPEAFGALFTEDAVSLPSQAPLIRGRDEIVASMRTVFAHMTFVGGTLHTITTHLEGTTATEIGAYDFNVTIAGDSRELRGRYLTVWRRVDGAWRIALDSSQPGAPAR